MNEQFTILNAPLAPHETFIGPPADAFDYSALQVVPDSEAGVHEPYGNKLITTINLTIDTCRWPFGDPVEADFHYCGELPLVGRPYCDMHNTKSYNKPRSRKITAPAF